MTTITVSDVTCPLCGAEEVNVNTGLLNVRGYKVGDEHGWWSHCLLSHSLTLNEEEVEIPECKAFGDSGGIWFVHSKITGGVIVEITDKGRFVLA